MQVRPTDTLEHAAQLMTEYATAHLVVVDPLRAGHERRYHPGEANVRMADAIVINKVDSATPDQVDAVEASVRELNPRATAAWTSRLSGPEPGRSTGLIDDVQSGSSVPLTMRRLSASSAVRTLAWAWTS